MFWAKSRERVRSNGLSPALTRAREQTAGLGQYSISFSIAYVRVAEWIHNGEEGGRAQPEILAQAEVHALKLGDQFILDAIERARAQWKAIDDITTPKLPPPPGPEMVKEIEKDWRYAQIKEVVGEDSHRDFSRPPDRESIQQAAARARLDEILDEFIKTMI